MALRAAVAITMLAGLALAPCAHAAKLAYDGNGAGAFDYEAEPGESNHLILGYDGSSWSFTDTVPITIEYPEEDASTCLRPTPDSAICPIAAVSQTQPPFIELGDGDDTFTYASDKAPPGPPMTIGLGPGNDTATGSPGPDEIWGEAGNDTIRGGGGNDVLRGGEGTNTLEGDEGDDELQDAEGSGGTLVGGPGHDTFIAGTDEAIDARDGLPDEFVSCEGPPRSLSYDAASAVRNRNVTDQVEGSIGGSQCFGAGNTGYGEAQPVKRRLHFQMTRHTHILKVPFECAAAARFGCIGEASIGVAVGIVGVGCSSQEATGTEFFILPGQRLTVPLLCSKGIAAEFLSLLGDPGHQMGFGWSWQVAHGGEKEDEATEPVTVNGHPSPGAGPRRGARGGHGGGGHG